MARKILLADDSVTAQNMGRKILADAGYEVITVNNGSAALKKIAELKPDLVILDVYMPGYSGLEVCQRLKDSQDSSRIPVLLTVGKLEPFKPEEAQRVRAEGFIVKPFEASELLSALSKLEDKVVPRAEPTKPGRFARAIAAQEGSGRGKGTDADNEDNGWKNRIGFPHTKTEAEQKLEKETDDSSIYNPINRDLRTVVETPAEMAAERAVEAASPKPPKAQPAKAAEPSVAVAAFVPPGLPKDVTPEEVAAIAAAAAQMQMLNAALKKDPAVAAAQVETTPARAPEEIKEKEQSQEKLSSQAQAEAASASTATNTTTDPAPAEVTSHSEAENRSGGEAHVSNTNRRRRWNDPKEEPQDVPVTMASAPNPVVTGSEAEPRWTAVAVALDTHETTVSLEAEMQKAYEAFVAEETAARENSAPVVESALEAVVAEISTSQSVPDAEPAISPASEGQPLASASPQAAAFASSVTEPANIPQLDSPVAAAAPVEAQLETVSASAEPHEQSGDVAAVQQIPAEQSIVDSVAVEPSPAQTLSDEESDKNKTEQHARDHSQEYLREPATHGAPQINGAAVEIADADNAASQTIGDSPAPQELSPAAPVESRPAEAAASADLPPITSTSDHENVDNNEIKSDNNQEDSEVVKTTAAAWANWRQIRDTGHAEPARPEFEVSGITPQEPAAMAVAAGAEQIPHETPTPSAENSSDIASIVDSVLADLRPKLMAEISRKMSEKK